MIRRLTKADMATWLRIRRTYDNDSVTASRLRVVGTDKLPAPDDFGMAVTAEREAREAVDRIAGLRTHPAYGPLIALNADQTCELAGDIAEGKGKAKNAPSLRL